MTCNKNKNARQENGSNAMPETTTIGTADFKTYTTEVKDPMFNVPCSGSVSYTHLTLPTILLV